MQTPINNVQFQKQKPKLQFILHLFLNDKEK